MYALTVRQPWAWAIANGKDVENRTWRTKHRGLLAIHAAARLDYETAFAAVARLHSGDLPPRWWREPGVLPTSAIVAVVDLHDIVRDSTSRWAMPGQWHWLLRDVRPLAEPVPCVGARGVWEVGLQAAEVLRQVAC